MLDAVRGIRMLRVGGRIMCMCIYTYVIYTCVYMYIYIYTHTYTHMYVGDARRGNRNPYAASRRAHYIRRLSLL